MYILDGPADGAHCPKCNVEYCAKCNEIAHPKKSCEEVKAEQERRKNPILRAQEAMAAATIRVCPVCKTEFQKDSGCNFIVCTKCKSDGKTVNSCYLCRQQINDYSHFCRRPLCKGECGECHVFHEPEKHDDPKAQRVAALAVLRDAELTDREIDGALRKLGLAEMSMEERSSALKQPKQVARSQPNQALAVVAPEVARLPAGPAIRNPIIPNPDLNPARVSRARNRRPAAPTPMVATNAPTPVLNRRANRDPTDHNQMPPDPPANLAAIAHHDPWRRRALEREQAAPMSEFDRAGELARVRRRLLENRPEMSATDRVEFLLRWRRRRGLEQEQAPPRAAIPNPDLEPTARAEGVAPWRPSRRREPNVGIPNPDLEPTARAEGAAPWRPSRRRGPNVGIPNSDLEPTATRAAGVAPRRRSRRRESEREQAPPRAAIPNVGNVGNDSDINTLIRALQRAHVTPANVDRAAPGVRFPPVVAEPDQGANNDNGCTFM